MIICDVFVMIKHMYCGGSITIMWSLNVFIRDFALPCRRVTNQSSQLKTVKPVNSLKVFQLSSDVNCHPGPD